MISDYTSPLARRHSERSLFFFLLSFVLFGFSAASIIVYDKIDVGARFCAAGIISNVFSDVFRKLAAEDQARADRWREESRGPRE